LFCLGMIFLIINYFKKKKKTIYLLWWFLGILIFMSLYITVAFDRYFLPIIPYIVMIESYAIVSLFGLIYNKVIQKFFKQR
jgi:hypothetical protein